MQFILFRRDKHRDVSQTWFRVSMKVHCCKEHVCERKALFGRPNNFEIFRMIYSPKDFNKYSNTFVSYLGESWKTNFPVYQISDHARFSVNTRATERIVLFLLVLPQFAFIFEPNKPAWKILRNGTPRQREPSTIRNPGVYLIKSNALQAYRLTGWQDARYFANATIKVQRFNVKL